MTVVYWTIAEILAGLSKEDFWFTSACVRTTTLAAAVGGLSQLLSEILYMTFPQAGGNLERTGMAVRLANGTTMRLFLKFKVLVADEAAIHAAWLCKGASGTKPCLKCIDIYNSRWQGFAEGRGVDPRLKSFSAVVRESDCSLQTKKAWIMCFRSSKRIEQLWIQKNLKNKNRC